MTEESDDSDPTMQLRGTASRGNPFAGESPPDSPDEDGTITIRTSDGSVRKYELTDDVKEGYETLYEQKFDSAEVFWYDMWWDGTELVIEYEGCIRDESVRPDYEDMSPEEIQKMMMSGRQPKMDGIPKRENRTESSGMNLRDLMQGNRPEPKVSIDISDEVDDDSERLDEGVVPVWNTTRIDIQERADARPLQVEDLFVKPWTDEETHMPINTDHEDGELDEEMFEVDFRDFTDDPDQTVRDGARGDRWGLGN